MPVPMGPTYLRGSDVFPCSLDPTSFHSALGVDTSIPGGLDKVLDLENRRYLAAQILVTLELNGVDV